MTRARILLIVVLLGLAVAPLNGVVRAQTAAITLSAQTGYDGYYKDAHWIPIRIQLTNDGPDVTGMVKIAAPRYSGSTLDYTRVVDLPSGARKEIHMYISIEGYVSKINISYVSGNEVLVNASARAIQIGASDLLMGVLASSPTAFNALTQVEPINGKARLAQLTIADLPPAAEAWKSLDALVIADVDTGQFSDAQREAIRAWVADGGRLFLVGGPNWQKVAAGLDTLLPVVPKGTLTVTDLSALAGYAHDVPPDGEVIAVNGTLLPGAVTTVYGIADNGARVPLIVENKLGYGRVNMLMFDPTLVPIKGWRGMENVYRGLLAVTTEQPGWANAYRNWYNAGEAVNAIPGIGLPHVLQICVFLAGYIALVGPLNYLFLRRIKRRELAWVTIPAIVVLFTGITYVASFALRGTRPTLHRLTVAQVWETSDRAQVEALIGVFSPRREQYDIQLDGDLLLRPLPSDTYYGGVDTSVEGILLEQGDSMVARNVRVDVGAIKPFVAQGQVPAPKFSSDLVFTVTGSQSTLTGTIQNLSDVILRDAVVLTAGGYESVGDVLPGSQITTKVTLVAGRAIWSLQSANQVLAPGVTLATAYVPGYSTGYDSTIENILGTVSYYDSREIYRRYSLFTWMFDPYSSGGRGSGTYLIGWSNQSPVSATIVNQMFNVEDETLYIVRLEPKVVVSEGALTIPPGLMIWETLDPGQGGGGSPYDSYLGQGYFTLRFKPSVLVDFDTVTSLMLHLTSYGATGNAPLVVSLWDQVEGEWVAVKTLRWGDNNVVNPSRFVAADGHLDVRVENNSFQNSVSIEKLDFTLVVQR